MSEGGSTTNADRGLPTEEEMRQAMRLYVETARTLAESGGAAALAGALKTRDAHAGRTVALILSGGNATAEQLRRALM
jgi:threonine dehydratase